MADSLSCKELSRSLIVRKAEGAAAGVWEDDGQAFNVEGLQTFNIWKEHQHFIA
jgi:hypothetical protein